MLHLANKNVLQADTVVFLVLFNKVNTMLLKWPDNSKTNKNVPRGHVVY